jgi:hypothetical protein
MHSIRSAIADAAALTALRSTSLRTPPDAVKAEVYIAEMLWANGIDRAPTHDDFVADRMEEIRQLQEQVERQHYNMFMRDYENALRAMR